MRPATMADVARLAGVSLSTVSRMLSGGPPVSPKRQARIQEAIDRLGYRPSAAARALASGQSNVIAVLAGDTTIYGYATTIRGVEEAARALGYSVMIVVVDSAEPADVDAAVTTALSQQLAGVVVLKFDPPGVAALHALPAGLPVVALSGVREKDVPQALIDEAQAGEQLTKHLLDLGHPTVHHVRVPPSRREDGRTTGWRRALKKAGATVPPVIDVTWEPQTGRTVGRRIAEMPDVTAVFCGNDELAMGVIRGLADKGLAVPEDVSVVGFDDHPLAEVWMPALTTARQDFSSLGRRGLTMLARVIAGEPPEKAAHEPAPIVVRESSGPPAASRLRGAAETGIERDAGIRS
ncbi:LacI family DNA-binding transcriptional regulator [Demequina lignilytica]|uniref:LacI family DNA-binding transcriptional regulator n=1 Tax=Demequina lignilytica TaxID=3051663 RepID=A0AB35MIA1_9MICO|nr:LacI family DNA-binding transcriptional regulator [Demequina sp. SYSU T0a273]MDN4483503.1 LacI family DNA-binding transcriptional regulator [Demequina sp. SYSU T0a273]